MRKALEAGAIAALIVAVGCGGSVRSQGSSSAASSSSVPEETPARVPRGKVACRLHSCSPPYYCNEESGICEMLPCQEKKDCPYDYRCDLSVGVCR